ncbi:MAG: hypothetical protein NTX50_08955 [Candidatus Sumerlaeota bacterium]|nr:hypothetical protein [Candidatus Sumerlaeota bacterium]
MRRSHILIGAAGFVLFIYAFAYCYPTLLEFWVARWGENAAKRAAWLARSGRLAEAEAALREAAARKKVWRDAEGREHQRVYLGAHIATDYRDFVEAGRAFLEAHRPALARMAAWEAIFRYHAVNRADVLPEAWRLLAESARAQGDADCARKADGIANAVRSHPPVFPSLSEEDASSSPSRALATGDERALLPSAFKKVDDGRFNPGTSFRATTESLFFDMPCVAESKVPAIGGSTAAAAPGGVATLVFEARGQSAYGWPPLLVAQLGGEYDFQVIAAAQWKRYAMKFNQTKAASDLTLIYPNHDAEETSGAIHRRALELRNLSIH